MATRSKEEKLECLNCPMCLDVLRNATFLSCGHSFCRDCLEAYDNQHKDLNHIVCPVCRKSTKLDQERVAGLTPNFLAKGLEDILKVDGSAYNQENDLSSKFCPLHSHVYKDIYCQPCSEFICLTCFIDSHQGHKIMKQEELEKELNTMKYALLEKSTTRKTHIEHCLSEAALQRDVMNSHLSGLEREVRDAFAIKVVALQQNDEDLLEKIEGIRKDLTELESCFCHGTELIGKIRNSVKLLTRHANKPTYPDVIKADHLTCADLEDSLKKATDEESTTCVEDIRRNVQSDIESNSSQNKTDGAGVVVEAEVPPASTLETANATPQVKTNGILRTRNRQGRKQQDSRKVHFCTAGDELPDLGCIDVGDNDIESNSRENTTDDAGVSEDAGMTTASSLEIGDAAPHGKTTSATGIPDAILNNSLSIVRSRAFPVKEGRLFGMAALSNDAVVIGYGSDRTGCDRFTLSGDESQYIGSEVGYVHDIAFLSRGLIVISKFGVDLFVYHPKCGIITEMRYACQQSRGFHRMCTDQHDNIYAVNMESEICVFKGCSPHPQRRVDTGYIRPKQICVTKTGIMITSTCDYDPSTVTVFDWGWRVGTSIIADNMFEFVYATVDSLDRVLVATVELRSDEMRLTRYRLQGIQLVEEVRFQHLRMPGQNRQRCVSFSWCPLFYIVSLTPNMIAVSFQHHLSFIQLGM